MADFTYNYGIAYSNSGGLAQEGAFTSDLTDAETTGPGSTTFESGDTISGPVDSPGAYLGTAVINGELFFAKEVGPYTVFYGSVGSPGTFPAAPTNFSDIVIDSGATFTVCFSAGTLVVTAAAETVVEDLRVGDLIRTEFGDLVPVKWIGRQTVFPRFGPAERMMPVRFAAGSLGRGLPHSDLTVTADHGMLVGGVI